MLTYLLLNAPSNLRGTYGTLIQMHFLIVSTPLDHPNSMKLLSSWIDWENAAQKSGVQIEDGPLFSGTFGLSDSHNSIFFLSNSTNGTKLTCISPRSQLLSAGRQQDPHRMRQLFHSSIDKENVSQ